jgi:hypothetical protein
LAKATIYVAETFPHNLALVSVLYIGKRPEVDNSITGSQRRPKQKKGNKTMKKPNLVRFSLALASLVAVTIASGQDPRPLATGGGRLQGTWETQITLTDCAGHVIRSFPSLLEFVAGGTVVESTAGTPPALKTPGLGVWRHTTGNTYAIRFKIFNFDAQNVFTGWTIIAGETTVDATGDTRVGPATVEVYDPNGVLLVTLCAETVGTRFEL